MHVCTFWAGHLKISFDLVAICIGTRSEVCAQKVHVIRRSQISTGLKTVFKPDWNTKQEKTWKHFLKHSLFQRWIENIVSVSTWQRPCELMMGLSGIFFGLFSLRPPRDGRKLFLWLSNCHRLPRYAATLLRRFNPVFVERPGDWRKSGRYWQRPE